MQLQLISLTGRKVERVVDRDLPLEEDAAAHCATEGRETFGKVVRPP